MGIMDRTRAIDILEEEIKTSESLSGDCKYCEYVMHNGINHIKYHTSEEFREAARLAIASLKTDDYFELMGDDVETYTKADMVAMLTDLLLAIQNLDTPPKYKDEDYFLVGTGTCQDIIQNKINKLKGNENGNK